ncbi:hypothetical protein EDM57_19690 [Brevibacillus gelatini]|uniref:Uracil-DNA glycosylase-like domain-containing protein n=1 Tax=Brevibacillus gelatini TaxID=1655277 RepID=A0A3M8AQZ8_9BACL|nr:hypothetical protein [Brevibacillus gelatini]RNB53519.1 hypothetical protein EDM57_19690 [Brevibacillus gelatini]
MDQINRYLSEMYIEYWNKLKNQLVDRKVDLSSLSNPFLIDVVDSYRSASVKVLFVGKETCGWGQYIGTVDQEPWEAIIDLQKDYIKFRQEAKWAHTPFWRASKAIYDRLNPNGPADGYMTSNLIKLDQKNTRPSPEVEEIICSNFPLLPYEIKALSPDVVIFFTGPYYDERLKKTFAGALFETVNDLAPKVLSRIKHEMLPPHSYRTYHPGYSLRGKKTKATKFDPMVDAIVKQVTTTK